MLFKNGKKYDLTPADSKKVKGHFSKLPVDVIYTPGMEKVSPSKHNKLKDKPASVSFDYRSSIRTPSGIEEWRYAENVTYDNNNRIQYHPKKFIYTGRRVIGAKDIELLFFLLLKCPHGLNNLIDPEDRHRKPKFMFEDLGKVADDRVKLKAAKSKIETLLFNDDLCLGEKKLRNVAKALFIPNVEDLTFNMVKLAVDDQINKIGKKGPQAFLDLIDTEAELSMRSKIQIAIDNKVIAYYQRDKEWRWMGEDGQMSEKIVKIPATQNQNIALYEYIGANAKFFEELNLALASKDLIEKTTSQVE